MSEGQVTYSAPSRSAPLSWGQVCILKPLLAYGAESTYFNGAITVTLDEPIGRPAFERAVRRLVERHESLRTAVVPLSVRGEQVVIGQGVVPVAWAEPGRAGPQVAAALGAPFDLSGGGVLRLVVEEDEAGIRAVHAIISHLVADGHAVGLLETALRESLTGTTVGAGAHPGAVDLAVAEQSSRSRARSERAVERWLDHLTLVQEPGPLRHEPEPERWVRLRLESEVLLDACTQVVRQLRVGASAPVLGPALATVGRRLRQSYLCAKVIIGNRLRPEDRALLTPMAQDGVVGWTAGHDVEEQIRIANREMMLAGVTSRYDPNALDDAVQARWPDRATRPEPQVLFNDIRSIALPGHVSVASAPTGSTVRRVASYPYQDCAVFITVRGIAGGLGVDLLVDTAMISADEATGDLVEIESQIVDLASAYRKERKA